MKIKMIELNIRDNDTSSISDASALFIVTNIKGCMPFSSATLKVALRNTNIETNVVEIKALNSGLNMSELCELRNTVKNSFIEILGILDKY